VLTLKGEKRSETEDKDRQFTERYYGRFERRIPLAVEVREDEEGEIFHLVTLWRSTKEEIRLYEENS